MSADQNKPAANSPHCVAKPIAGHVPLAEPKRDPIVICRSCGGCVTEQQPLPCQQESCGGTWSSC